MTKKSSAQACQSDFLTQSTLLSLKTLRESKIGAKGEERGALVAWELLSTSGSAVNESITVRSEERGIYTLSRNLTVQIYVGIPMQISGLPTLIETLFMLG